MCDGATYEEALEHQVALTEEHGWSLIAVTGELPWTYTIGLRWHLNLPELIVVGWPDRDAAAIIHQVVDAAADGEAPRPGMTLGLPGGTVTFGPVAAENVAGDWFAWWASVAHATGNGFCSLRALQVRPVYGEGCTEPHRLVDHALARRCTPGALARRRAAHVLRARQG